MLLTKEVECKWNSKTKKHYEEKGYVYTKMKDSFIVKVEDLTDGSSIKVLCSCDYCGTEYLVPYGERKRRNNRNIDKDCCKNCHNKKAEEVNMMLYGTKTSLENKEFREKVHQAGKEKYGVDNVFQSEEIKNKIKETNMKKYGVEQIMQSEHFKENYKKVMLSKYGVDNYSKSSEFREKMSGENNPLWKGGVEHHRVERSTIEYRDWRKGVFSRDEFKCQCCGEHSRELQAHHIRNWKDNEDIRYDVDNGITLCVKCHMAFHSEYGKKENNLKQLNEFIDTYGQNVC